MCTAASSHSAIRCAYGAPQLACCASMAGSMRDTSPFAVLDIAAATCALSAACVVAVSASRLSRSAHHTSGSDASLRRTDTNSTHARCCPPTVSTMRSGTQAVLLATRSRIGSAVRNEISMRAPSANCTTSECGRCGVRPFSMPSTSVTNSTPCSE